MEDVYGPDGLPRDDVLLDHFKQEGRVATDVAQRIITTATALFKQEPNVVDVPAPVTIVGDIHGQFFDLVKLFSVGGDPKNTRYLFLGDYVDRGYFSLECVLYLWALKARYKDTFTLLRGNHECRHLTDYFTFKKEVEYKVSTEIYDLCMASFDALPLVAIMNKQFFCVHGGLSPEIFTVDDVRAINRFTEPDETGPLCDLLWSDPHEDFDRNLGSASFVHNDTRGCSYFYTFKAACEFLDRNGFLSIIRAHEAQDVGYKMYKPNPKTSFPAVITIFSAPNYLDVYGNKGAVLVYEQNSMNIKKFSHSPHPYWLPNFMDVFTWSLPFIGEKTTEMFMHIMNVCSAEELAGEDKDMDDLEMKMKTAMTRVARRRSTYGILAEVNQQQLMLQGAASPSGEIPAVHGDLRTFEGARSVDKQNEAKPSREAVARARNFRRRQTLEDIDPLDP